MEGALLHDVGKILSPTRILNKARQLNDSEKLIVAMHSLIGAALLEAQTHFSKAVINIVRRRHERLDGSGYPDGWRALRTAKLVRIVAVCDAFCEMTEDRPYEDAWPWPEAVERLKSMHCQYDRNCVEVLEGMLLERGTNIHLHEPIEISLGRAIKKASGVQRSRSTFYAPRFRGDVRLIQ